MATTCLAGMRWVLPFACLLACEPAVQPGNVIGQKPC